MLNNIDTKEYEELLKWEESYIYKRENGIINKTYEKVSKHLQPITTPIVKVSKSIGNHKLAQNILNAIEVSLSGAFYFTHDKIKYFYKRNYILRKLGLKDYEELFQVNSVDIKCHVRKVCSESQIMALVEGAGLGLGGVGMTLAEIPIFFALIVRVQQQICSCYGYDPEDEFEQAYMLKAMDFSSIMQTSSKVKARLELNALRVAIKRHTYKELKDMGGKYLIPSIAKEFAQKHGKRLGKKKMLQSAPLIGLVFGGFFNYEFIRRVANTTDKLYRKRYLEDKKEYLIQTNQHSF